MKDTLTLLKQICDFSNMSNINNDKYISRYDELVIRQIDNKPLIDLSNMYASKCIPHFFWGNIIDPKIIILGNNPSYSSLFDEVELNLYGKDLIDTYNNYSKDNLINFFHNTYNIRENDYYKETHNHYKGELPCKCGLRGNRSTYEWWHDVTKDDLELTKAFQKNEVAVFNLVGYHSYDYKRIKKLALTSDKESIVGIAKEKGLNDDALKKLLSDKYHYEYLPTTNAIIKYVKELIHTNSNIKIYALWEKHKEWDMLLEKKDIKSLIKTKKK